MPEDVEQELFVHINFVHLISYLSDQNDLRNSVIFEILIWQKMAPGRLKGSVLTPGRATVVGLGT